MWFPSSSFAAAILYSTQHSQSPNPSLESGLFTIAGRVLNREIDAVSARREQMEESGPRLSVERRLDSLSVRTAKPRHSRRPGGPGGPEDPEAWCVDRPKL